MEIDLDRARRAIIELGTALAEVRGIVRFGPGSMVRVKTENEVIELPMSWAAVSASAKRNRSASGSNPPGFGDFARPHKNPLVIR